MSMPMMWHMPSVIATASGIDAATSSALRHSMNTSATTTTIENRLDQAIRELLDLPLHLRRLVARALDPEVVGQFRF